MLGKEAGDGRIEKLSRGEGLAQRLSSQHRENLQRGVQSSLSGSRGTKSAP